MAAVIIFAKNSASRASFDREPIDPIATSMERDMSARSVNASVKNESTVNLLLLTSSISLPHGEWVTYPEARLAPNDTTNWRTDSAGFMTGTEGSFTYQFIYNGPDGPSIETLKFYWDNPYAGGNGYSITCSVPPPAFEVSYSGGGGDNSTVTYHFKGNS